MQRRSIVRLLSGYLLGAGIVAGFGSVGAAEAKAAEAKTTEPIIVFAAASLRNVLDDMIADWHRAGGRKAVVSYAGTSALARQIEQDAPAAILISADEQWMRYLVDKDFITKPSVSVFARNRLVLVAPAALTPVREAVVIDAGFPLQQLLGPNGRFAMADASHVPAGRYGKAALQSAGLFELVAPHLTRSANVRLALALVARGECPLGLVYASDAHVEPAVRVIGRFQPEASPSVSYPAALIKQANTLGSDAAALLTWLLDPARGEYLQRHGLLVPAKG